MKQVCKFNKARDLRAVAPHLSIDLGEVIRTNKVPSTGTELSYNEIESPGAIHGRVQDVFASLDIERGALAQGRADAAAAKAAAAAATAQVNSSTNDVVNPS